MTLLNYDSTEKVTLQQVLALMIITVSPQSHGCHFCTSQLISEKVNGEADDKITSHSYMMSPLMTIYYLLNDGSQSDVNWA